MKCKTSCFNPSLAKNDLRRFWPLPVCSFLAFFVSLVLPIYRFLYIVNAGLLGQYPNQYLYYTAKHHRLCGHAVRLSNADPRRSRSGDRPAAVPPSPR